MQQGWKQKKHPPKNPSSIIPTRSGSLRSGCQQEDLLLDDLQKAERVSPTATHFSGSSQWSPLYKDGEPPGWERTSLQQFERMPEEAACSCFHYPGCCSGCWAGWFHSSQCSSDAVVSAVQGRNHPGKWLLHHLKGIWLWESRATWRGWDSLLVHFPLLHFLTSCRKKHGMRLPPTSYSQTNCDSPEKLMPLNPLDERTSSTFCPLQSSISEQAFKFYGPRRGRLLFLLHIWWLW